MGAFAPPFSTEKAIFKIRVQAGHSNSVATHTIIIVYLTANFNDQIG